ncbi:hypothetical protein vBSsoS008_020 [Shigella phage vB_SsoS_008]|nr:hypothetical protein vBSsoS008_020 [Shigella phage vB_SsoS_008]
MRLAHRFRREKIEMMVSTDKFFTNTKTSEVFELVHTDNGFHMHDNLDAFILSLPSDYDDLVYYNPAVNTQFPVPIETRGEEA